MKKLVLVTMPVQDPHKQLLESMAPDWEFIYKRVGHYDLDLVHKANIIIGNVPVGMIAGSKNLEWLQLNSSGANQYTTKGVLGENVILTCATGAYGLAISEHMLALTLTLQKNIHLYRDNQHNHLWREEGGVTSIFGSTVLIIGVGDIGSEYGRRMKALGSYVIGVKRTMSSKPDYLDELYTVDSLDEVLPKADIVALCLPETKDTNSLMNRDRLQQMKKCSILINVGRGSAMDTEALCDVLESGHILGAGLDVFDQEPLGTDHRLWDIPNVVITPHISGGYTLPETFERIISIGAKNLKHFYANEELEHLVDFNTGYRQSK